MTWGWLLVLLAAVTWGTTGTTSRLLAGQAGAGPLVVAALRLLVAAPLLLLAGYGRPQHKLGGPGFLPAGMCVAAYQLCFFSAVPLAGIAVTALLAICSSPLMIAAGSALFLRERLSRVVVVALVIGVGGTALLVGGAHPAATPDFATGAVLALGAGASYAAYVVITKAALASADPTWLAAVTFTVAAVLLLPVLVAQRPSGATLAAGAPLFLYLGAVPTAFAYFIYTSGLHRTTATAAGLAALLEPLTATTLGVLLFGERVATTGLIGAVLLLAALALLTTRAGATVPAS